MKLLDELREQVSKLGELRRAWFTTFGLSIPFFETHVLPTLLGADPPSGRMDYEQMQLQLVAHRLDVRLFCDLRLMEADQLKRTAVPVHGILPRRLQGVDPRYFGEESLFHPKVIFLEDEHGRMVLGTGSANLSVSGWGKNQEVFVFRPVSNNEQYQQIKRFFEPLMGSAGLGDEHAFRVRRQFDGADHDWRFVHSFERTDFLQQLVDADTERLTIWSPYFSDDLAALLGELRKKTVGGLMFSIVPDRVGNRYLRTRWTAELGQLIADGVLNFHDYPRPRADDIEMTHAKLWLASGRQARLAVGSWNCTKPGCASFERRNVEAGILLQAAPGMPIAGTRLNLGPTDFACGKMLQEESLQLTPYPLPFELQVSYDWARQRYTVQGQLHETIQGPDYLLHLPGVKRRLQLSWSTRRNGGVWPLEPIEHELADNEALLADHSYQVWRGDNLEYRGLVQEIGQAYRRALGYDSLDDLLNDLVNGVDSGAGDTPKLRRSLRHDDATGDEPAAAASATGGMEMSYFRLFHAFEQFRSRLCAVKDRQQLDNLLFIHPASLQELVSKVNEHVAGAAGTAVFKWFLVQEAESLHKAALEAYARCREKYQRTAPPTDSRWASLKPNRRAVRLPAQISGNATYMKKLRETCGYVR